MAVSSVCAEDAARASLIAAYRTAPQGYPEGQDERGVPYAKPDTSVWYRWHFYNSEAIKRFDQVSMASHVQPYNDLESDGVKLPYRSPVKFAFVPDHVTKGEKALKVTYVAAAFQRGTASIGLGAVAPPSFQAKESRVYRRHIACAFWAHYRWVKFDAFNPEKEPVHISACGVPFVLAPGRNIVAVRTPDAVGHDGGPHAAFNGHVWVSVRQPKRELTLYFDNVRVEQEVPRVITEKGKLLQFAAYAEKGGAPVLWPGFTPVGSGVLFDTQLGFGWVNPGKKRKVSGSSWRSFENGILWGGVQNADAPFRIAVPKGRWGVCIFAYPGSGYFENTIAHAGLTVKINGKSHEVYPKLNKEEEHRIRYGKEDWDYRPGACVWEELLRDAVYPPARVAYVDVPEGTLDIAFPTSFPNRHYAFKVRTIAVFPDADKEAAQAELGRLNYLLAESWDVTHAWVKGPGAKKKRYIGSHEEAANPEEIPERLKALNLADDDWARGFKLFRRGLAEAVYSDTIPSPAEASVNEVRAFSAPGEHECATVSLLPLKPLKGLSVAIGDLKGPGGVQIPASAIDVRISRQHQKCMAYGHHNHTYNYEEYYLVKRPRLDLYPAVARRVYLDVAVPADASPGEYKTQIRVLNNKGAALAELPLVLEVLPVKLETPPVYFAGSIRDPLVQRYGFNTAPVDYDQARKDGWKGYTGFAHAFGGKAVKLAGYSGGVKNLLKVKDAAAAPIAEGHSGKGPRGFFPPPSKKGRGRDLDQDVAKRLMDAIPHIDILGVTNPMLSTCEFVHEIEGSYGGPRTTYSLANLQALRKGSKPFWIVDGLRYSKEDFARFTFGFWLWRTGAAGRATTLSATGQHGAGSYLTLCGITHGNTDRALMPSVRSKAPNPSRDLVLLREGIDDYRYIHTLEECIKRAEKKGENGSALASAKEFCRSLKESIALDLSTYFFHRIKYVCYAENWYRKPDSPWTTLKMDETRRQCAKHIVALKGR